MTIAAQFAKLKDGVVQASRCHARQGECPDGSRAALRTGYSFDDEEVVNKMPFFSGLELDHFSDRLHVIAKDGQAFSEHSLA